MDRTGQSSGQGRGHDRTVYRIGKSKGLDRIGYPQERTGQRTGQKTRQLTGKDSQQYRTVERTEHSA